jgi:excinuclease ABC subunit B
MNFQVVSDYQPATNRKPSKLAQGIVDGDQFQTLLGVTGSENIYGGQCDPVQDQH